ncbi:unnamed protein product [Rotaria socialis]
MTLQYTIPHGIQLKPGSELRVFSNPDFEVAQSSSNESIFSSSLYQKLAVNNVYSVDFNNGVPVRSRGVTTVVVVVAAAAAADSDSSDESTDDVEGNASLLSLSDKSTPAGGVLELLQGPADVSTEAGGDPGLPVANRLTLNKCVDAQKSVFFGGWNVRSCFHYSKQQLIIKQLQKYNIQVAALCETAIYDSGIKSIGDYTLLYSGLPNVNKTRSAHGVAVVLDKRATNNWKKAGSEWQAITERIVKVRLKCTPVNITFVAVYAPVNPWNKTMVDNSEKFYMDLQETIDGVPKKDMIVLMGDFNARVSQPQHSTTSRIVGPFTVDVQNENGERLIDFCTTNNLVVSNSFFQHKSVHQTSWMHPGTKKWHLLDYTLVNRKFRSSVEDVRFYRKASGSIGTDHHLMRSKIKLHLKSRKNNKNHNECRLDCTKLNDERVVDKFQKDILKKFEETKYIDVDVNVKYEILVQSLKENANKHLKLEKNNHQRQKEWLTKEILDAVENKSTTYLKWQQHRGSIMEQKYRKNYITQRKLVKILIDKRQTEY